MSLKQRTTLPTAGLLYRVMQTRFLQQFLRASVSCARDGFDDAMRNTFDVSEKLRAVGPHFAKDVGLIFATLLARCPIK